MRLAEIAGTLSIAADAGVSMPDGHALRGAMIAVRFAQLLGADERTVRGAYYLPLLAMSGCSAESLTVARGLGDEVAFGGELLGVDLGRPREVLPALLRLVRRGKGPIDGLASMARVLGLLGEMGEVGRAHCEVATHLAERFGFDAEFREALSQVFERWDGTGRPDGVKGEALALGIRIAHVAIDANVGHRLGGVEGAVALTRERSGRGLDPGLVERFASVAEDACSTLTTASVWASALDAEPLPHRTLDDEGAEQALRGIAHFADLKCRFTREHSTGVSRLAAAAARHVGLGGEGERLLRWAGLVHDVGRVAVTAAIWEKDGPLSDAERERIRLHTYVGERVLARAARLSAVAEIATLAHERLDDSGYHRRLPGSALSTAARILAAADVYHALREERPHRRAFDVERAAAEVSTMARSGRLCPDAARAVLAAAGHRVRPAARPSGLTDRENEVLSLVARGLTNKEIATRLDISPKTAGHHVQHVLEKLGVRTRAAATMLAMEQGLIGK